MCVVNLKLPPCCRGLVVTASWLPEVSVDESRDAKVMFIRPSDGHRPIFCAYSPGLALLASTAPRRLANRILCFVLMSVGLPRVMLALAAEVPGCIRRLSRRSFVPAVYGDPRAGYPRS